MRRLAVSEFVTVDGVMDDPGGAEGGEFGGWAFRFDRAPRATRSSCGRRWTPGRQLDRAARRCRGRGVRAQAGGVDEYRLMVFPVVLGQGKRLFAEGTRMTALALTDSKASGECTILVYEPKR